jgi:hypothetical protein
MTPPAAMMMPSRLGAGLSMDLAAAAAAHVAAAMGGVVPGMGTAVVPKVGLALSPMPTQYLQLLHMFDASKYGCTRVL